MNREHWKELLPVITAFANGEDVQVLDGAKWLTLDSPSFLDPAAKYRIAPKPRKAWVLEYDDGECHIATNEKELAEYTLKGRTTCHEIELPPLP
jgi:hypothetical protein